MGNDAAHRPDLLAALTAEDCDAAGWTKELGVTCQAIQKMVAVGRERLAR